VKSKDVRGWMAVWLVVAGLVLYLSGLVAAIHWLLN